MASPPAVLGPSGQVIPPQAIARIRDRAAAPRGRMRGALSGPYAPAFAYDAAGLGTAEMADWFPVLRSADTEVNLYRDRIASRARDLHRNDGWAKGAIGRILDSTIGAEYRLLARPHYKRLAQFAKGFDAVWAKEFADAVEPMWSTYAVDAGRFCDVRRKLTITRMFRLALGHKLVDGDSLILAYWLPERVGKGGAEYATAFTGVDPDRLSNPYQRVDSEHFRNGIELDDLGAPVAAHVRKAHQNDWYDALQSMEWERVPIWDDDGWQRVFHDMDPDRFEQNRGISIFAPIIPRLKMLARYYGVELSAATIASAFGVYVTSPFDADMIRNALESDDDGLADGLGWYQDMRTDFHSSTDLRVGEAKIATLAPGEDIKTVAPTRPNASFSPFTHEMLRSFAAVLGMSSEQVHNDYSEASWSSARAGIVEAEKTFSRRLGDFDQETATPIYGCWLHEVMDRRLVPLPKGAPSYLEARTAYRRSRWLGARRGWVDPVAERQGEVLGLDAGFDTLEAACARQGLDWEETLHQRSAERKLMEELGLPAPEWMGKVDASSSIEKPTAE